MALWKGPLEKIDEFRWRIPRRYKPAMKVDGILYATEKLLPKVLSDQSPEQLANVACMPGIVKYALAMPDVHWGYGMPVGGVAAFDMEEGVVSPGAVGYDINCGVRLIRSDLRYEEIKEKLHDLADTLYALVPAGVGSHSNISVSASEFPKVLTQGARWAVSRGYGHPDDLAHMEANGCLPGADPETVSSRAVERGRPELGTLGAGNHFLEVQVVDTIYDREAAAALGLYEEGQITVMIHCGSRGFGHQVATDYLQVMDHAMRKYGITLPDRQLACTPLRSKEAKDYLAAMACAANYAWANRQCITHRVREAFERVFRAGWQRLGLTILYDVAHNIAKIEEYEVDGERRTVCVHRKGATRAFPKGHPELPEAYRHVGQPVLIPGDMGSYSYVLLGTERAMEEAFGSTCHGAGRQLSRKQALKQTQHRDLVQELEREGIIVRAKSRKTLGEEAPGAYKDVNEVIDTVHGAGISYRVARMRPIVVVKG